MTKRVPLQYRIGFAIGGGGYWFASWIYAKRWKILSFYLAAVFTLIIVLAIMAALK